MNQYDHTKIEKKWQEVWEKKDACEASDSSKKPKFYALIEFPYPSGDGLHVGHIRSNTAMDIIARKRRAEGFNVLYPIGWDAFGLPTENYAIKTGIHPKIVTKQNTDTFRRQLKSLGFSFDWSREINTTDPAYYRWTQWIFLQFLKHNLAYKKKMAINWCPKDKIGLANEEVVDGCCERCGTPVEQREKEQWMLAITKYADRLEKDLQDVDFLEQIKTQQRNWIGRSQGAEINFEIIAGSETGGAEGSDISETVAIFTTRPDTLFGVTYIALSLDHPVLAKIESEIQNWPQVKQYISEARKKKETSRVDATKDKTGIVLEGIFAINPATKERIPVWVANYVNADYGTGAVMAVPAHDERDFEFARKYKLPVKEVIEPLFLKVDGEDGVHINQPFVKRHAAVAVIKHWSEDKYLCLKWKQTDWRGFVIGGIEPGEDEVQTALREIVEETGYTSPKFVRKLGGIIHAQFFHKVKNENRWAHFHGLYFELTNGDKKETDEKEKAIHEVIWVDKKEVDKFLDWVTDMRLIWHRFEFPDDFPGRSGLHTTSRVSEIGILTNSGKFNGMKNEDAKKAIVESVGGKMVTTFKLRDWVFSRQRYWGEPIPVIHCKTCGIVPVPEKDLPVELPEVKNYTPTDTGESPLAAISEWVNVKCPKCKGPAQRETDTMPNWAGSSWYFLRYIDPKNKKVFADPKKMAHWMPVDWYNGGMEHTTLHVLYSRFWNKFLYDLKLVPTSEPYKKRTAHGLILASNGEKMSKSKGNVVNPDQIVAAFGADTLRVHEMFLGPFDQAVSWTDDAIIGSRRFLERVWRLQEKVVASPQKDVSKVRSLAQKTIQKISDHIEQMEFNTAVSSLMIFTNELEKVEHVPVDLYETLLQLLAPFAPHITEELWANLGHKTSVHAQSWPQADMTFVQDDVATIALQINGKTRATFEAKKGLSEEEIKKMALVLPESVKWIGEKNVIKVISIKDRLINIVID